MTKKKNSLVDICRDFRLQSRERKERMGQQERKDQGDVKGKRGEEGGRNCSLGLESRKNMGGGLLSRLE